MRASPISKIFSKANVLGKNLHLVGCASLYTKSEIILKGVYCILFIKSWRLGVADKLVDIIRSKDFCSGILFPKLFFPTVRKNCSSDREKMIKFEAEV